MQFFSTRKRNELVSIKEATLRGLAPDGGLYMPQAIPKLSRRFWESIGGACIPEIAFEMGLPYVQDQFSKGEYQDLVERVFLFDAPLKSLSSQISVLELFCGPTLAFKDFGARFMAALMSWFIRGDDKRLTVLVATSGDTGGAVANGFLGAQGIDVIILYPSGKVSTLQEKQLTTNGENITALEVDGTFDDCQKMVKSAFNDPELSSSKRLTSANSINISRLLPQSFYYGRALAQLHNKKDVVTFSVPSGNFGNVTAGVIAKLMGAPIKMFLAATNQNDILPQYLKSGRYEPKPSVRTLSNAMDVGNPSNYERLQALFEGEHKKFTKNLTGYSYDDTETLAALSQCLDEHNYLLCPHSAIGYQAAKDHGGENTVVLATAHPAKFGDALPAEISVVISVPPELEVCLQKEKRSVKISKDFVELKNYLLA